MNDKLNCEMGFEYKSYGFLGQRTNHMPHEVEELIHLTAVKRRVGTHKYDSSHSREVMRWGL